MKLQVLFLACVAKAFVAGNVLNGNLTTNDTQARYGGFFEQFFPSLFVGSGDSEFTNTDELKVNGPSTSTQAPSLATTTTIAPSTTLEPTTEIPASTSEPSTEKTHQVITAKVKKDFSQCGIPKKTVLKKTKLVSNITLETTRRNFWTRIFGGTATLEGEYPWVAYLYERKNGKRNGFFCGGAILNRHWIVTAAHCITQPFSPSVYAISFGKHKSFEESRFEIDRNVSRMVMHPNFSSSSLKNDVMLLKVDKPIGFNRRRQPICTLPQDFPTDAPFGETFAGKRCTTLGWGDTESGRRSMQLLRLNIIILPDILCHAFTSIPTSIPYQGRPVKPGDPHFCAGGRLGEDTCSGDSGGPLICMHDDGRFYMHGITSYGASPCGQKNLPGIYTKMSLFSNWMEKVMTEK